MLKECEPSFSRGGDMAMDFLAGLPIKELQNIGKKADDEGSETVRFGGPVVDSDQVSARFG